MIVSAKFEDSAVAWIHVNIDHDHRVVNVILHVLNLVHEVTSVRCLRFPLVWSNADEAVESVIGVALSIAGRFRKNCKIEVVEYSFSVVISNWHSEVLCFESCVESYLLSKGCFGNLS